MLIRRGVALAAIGFSLLFTAACGGFMQPSKSKPEPPPTSSSPTPVAAALPTKEDLAKKYLAAAETYNNVLSKYYPIMESESMTLADGRAAGAAMGAANWTLIESKRAIRKSVEEPPGGYPTEAEFYKDVYSTLGQGIDLNLRDQGLWTRLRDAATLDEFHKAYNDPAYDDDGSVNRRMRSLLGLPDVPARP
jgi:hypothetical protein